MNSEELQPGQPLPLPKPPPPVPLVPLAIGLILGIAADTWLTPPTLISLLLAGAGAAVAFGSRRTRLGLAGLVLAAAGLGLLRHAVADRWLSDDHIVFFTGTEPLLTTVQGRVISSPYIAEPQPDVPRAYAAAPKTHFIIEVSQLAGRDGPISVSGKVGVTIKGPVLRLDAGDLVQMTGWVYRPRGPRNPGEYDWALHNRRNGLLVGISCDHAESVIVREKAGAGAWTRMLERCRGRLRGYLLDEAFDQDDPGAGVISAMVLATRSAVPRAMNQAFIRTGNAHYLAASGMNVAWLAVTGWVLMRLLGVYYRTTAVFVGLLILSYVLLAEPQPSIMRAGIMGLLWCLSVYLRGRPNVMNWLACSAIVILMIEPADCFRPAFQYSFMAVLAIVHLLPRLNRAIANVMGRTRWPQLGRFFSQEAYHLSLIDPGPEPVSIMRGLGRRAAYWLIQMLVLSFSAWIVTAPLCCYQFDQFTPWGAVGTFVLWFIAAPVTCWGYISLLLALLFPSSAIICGPVLKIGTDLLVSVVQLLARVPGTILDGRSPSLWWVLAVYATMALWLYRPAWLPWKHGFKLLVLILFLWWLVPPRWSRAESGTLQAWVLALGDGAGIVVELPDGKVIVCDFGTRSAFDAGPVGVSFLKQRGIHTLDAVFVSHANFDHFSGIVGLAGEISIGKVVVNDHFDRFAPQGSAAGRFLQAVRELSIPIEVVKGPQIITTDHNIAIEAVWPPRVEDAPLLGLNDTSTVLRISWQGHAILLPGDIGEVAIGRLLDNVDIRADALVLPHHGGVCRGTERFIAKVDPRVVMRSSGQRRSLTTSGIEALVANRSYFSTADVGCVRLRIDQQGACEATSMGGGDGHSVILPGVADSDRPRSVVQ
ncbi:MAG TPA: ComEC/Rec2 family competence protein [Phycisphaerae bacterium]|nr:ComEC/Rec2 family competence protein [Phycisphaerae bacterium]